LLRLSEPVDELFIYQKQETNKERRIMKHSISQAVLALLLLLCGSPGFTAPSNSDDLAAEAEKAIKALQSADSGLTNLFSSAAGFALFPSVGKGALIFGGEHGNGIVYEKGKPIGEATLTEINVGPQVGGGSFYEVIFFQTAESLANFKESNFEASAEVNVVAAREGAALTAKYRDGVIVFTLPRSGLMVQAAIGGQKFKYKPYKLKDHAKGVGALPRMAHLPVQVWFVVVDTEANSHVD
jgi:lipid-binding SYLF domain-containing protein